MIKRLLIINICLLTKGKFMKTFLSTLLFTLVPTFAFASEGGMESSAVFALSSALAISLAAIGGAFAQGKAASAALEGIARNPAASDKLFTPMIIALALIESLVIYAFVIAFLIKPTV